MVPLVGFELTTYRLQGGCSTPELKRHKTNNGQIIIAPTTDSRQQKTVKEKIGTAIAS